MAKRTCAIDGCDRRHYGHGWCQAHYSRWRKHGSPTGGGPVSLIGLPPEQRFWPKVNKNGLVPEYRPDLGPCWEWLAARASISVGGVGYGRFDAGEGRSRQAHRYAYETLVGPIPEGLQLDHLCRNTLCVNPSHLEPVTPRVNYRRGFGVSGRNARKTHCPQGHAYDGANTIQTRDGGRQCRLCSVEYQRQLRARRGAGPANATKTHCPKGHPYDEANTVRDGGSRKCRTCLRERFKRIDAVRAGRPRCRN